MRIKLVSISLSLIIPFSILFGFSCNGNSTKKPESIGESVKNAEKRPIAKLIRIDKPQENQSFSSGALIDLSVSLLGEEVPDSIRFYFDGSLLKTIYSEPWQFSIASKDSRLGKIPLKVIAYSGEKRPHTLTRFVMLYSDIVPKKNAYRLVNTYPHDKDAYTQGLLVHKGFFYESTGKEGRSTLRKVDIETGEVLMQHKLDSKFFGEGLSYLKGKFYQLTWQHNTGFVYDAESFTQIQTIHYDTQGWGLCTDGEKLFMSDGTNKIYVLEPDYFTVISSFEVYDNERAVYQLNELEYIDGELWANLYTSDLIARIDPLTGKVLAYYDLSGIIDDYDKNLDSEQVLNGIAWDSESKRMFVTGKNWSRLFEVELK
jgi:glutamine cyclotransferase